jgi:hypothetical protein
MTDSIVRFVFDDNTIRNDGLVNITALASAYKRATGKRKDTQHWLVTKEATESIAYLERVTGIPVTELVIAEHGAGTWVHPDLAEIFAQWISVEYRFAVVQLIRTAKENRIAAPPKPVQPPRQLTHGQQAVEKANEIRVITDTLTDNPRLAQLLIDYALIDIRVPSLPVTELLGVVEIARNLGFSTNHSSRVKLGSFIARQFKHLAVVEKRLCNGEMRDINCYPNTVEIQEAVRSFFS